MRAGYLGIVPASMTRVIREEPAAAALATDMLHVYFVSGLKKVGPGGGDATEEINIDYEGEEFKIGFNSRYLIDAISAMEGEKIKLELRSKQNPGVIRSANGYTHTSVVMPMRT